MQISVPTAASVTPTRPVLRDVTTRDWAATHKVGDSTLGAVAGRALQFELAGDGPPSQRALVPQTPAAAKLLEGEHGAAIEQILRGIAATTDPHENRTSIKGISLARGVRDFTVNSAINYLERGDVKGWKPAGGTTARTALDDALDAGRQVSKIAVAQAPDWINLGPFATRQLLRLAALENPTVRDEKLGAWLTTLAAHEPHHTITPPSTKDLIHAKFRQDPLPKDLEKITKEDPFAALKPLNWLEEGTADVLSSWAGVLPKTADRLGIPSLAAPPEPVFPEDFAVIQALQAAAARNGRFTPQERVIVDRFNDDQFGRVARSDSDRMQMIGMSLSGLRNYPTHVAGLHRLLALAGLDPTRPEDAPRASELLQGARITHVPGRIADAIIERHDIDPSRREQLRVAIRDAGEHVMSDPDAFDSAIAAVEALVDAG